MKLNILTETSAEIEFSDGTVVLFSNNQPVADYVPGKGYLRTVTPPKTGD